MTSGGTEGSDSEDRAKRVTTGILVDLYLGSYLGSLTGLGFGGFGTQGVPSRVVRGGGPSGLEFRVRGEVVLGVRVSKQRRGEKTFPEIEPGFKECLVSKPRVDSSTKGPKLRRVG